MRGSGTQIFSSALQVYYLVICLHLKNLLIRYECGAEKQKRVGVRSSHELFFDSLNSKRYFTLIALEASRAAIIGDNIAYG